MITDIQKVLAKGQPWPPESEVARMKLYKENTLLWKGKHEEVYGLLKRLYASSEDEANKLLVIINWPKRISTLWADLLLGDVPKLRAGDLKSPEQAYLNSIRERTSLWTEAYKVSLDVSRFGTGVLKVFAEEGQPAKVQAISPKNWFPIADASGQITEHLIAWVAEKRLNFELHRTGLIESGHFDLIEDKIASEAIDYKVTDTGFDQPLVFPIHNIQTSEDTEGTDDYQDIDKLLKRVESTFTRSGRILDVHSEPTLGVPETVLTRNTETGEVTYNPRLKVIPLDEGGQMPQYVTWDGQLTSAFTLVDKIMSQFYAISETCRTAFEPDTIGNQVSGTALRMLMMAPLKKVKRLKMQFDPQLKAALRAISYLEVLHGVKGAVPLDVISSTWYDGLPRDFSEEVRNITALKANGAITASRSQQMLFDLEGDELTAEVDMLRSEARETMGI